MHQMDTFQNADRPDLSEWTPETSLEIVGKAIPRLEGRLKVTGGARYGADVRLPGMLHARVLRSPLPHARIRRLDMSKAEALPGVRAVLSHLNAPRIEWYEGGALFDEVLRFVGDEVAAVAADSEEIAEDALRLIGVDYEPLPFVVSLDAALADGAPRVHQSGTSGKAERYNRGDVDAGLRESAVVIDQTYTTQSAVHNSLEAHGCVASWDGGMLTVWESTQGIFSVREQIAGKLSLPEHRVRVIKQHMGGGFGAKQIAWKHTAIAALLSKQTGAPVRLFLDREAESLAVGNRNPTRQHVRLGAQRDGTLKALDVRIEMQVGAYGAGGEGSNVMGAYQRLYRCPNVHVEQVPVYTNTGPAVSFRAPGYVEGAFALESAMDELSRELGLDPIDLRLRNYVDRDQTSGRPYTTPNGLRRCYEEAGGAFGWGNGGVARSRNAAAVNHGNGRRRRGVGVAAHDWGGGGTAPAYAWVKLNADGTADVITGTQDIGSGARTGLTQVAAEELGLPLDRVNLHLGDTASGPYAPTSAGSATQASVGPAIRTAAANAKRELLGAAAAFLEVPVERLRLVGGRIEVEGRPDRSVLIEEITRRVAPYMIQGRGQRDPNPPDRSIRTFGVQCVEVEVDLDSGEVGLVRLAAAHECGRIVNPTMVDSQVAGGITQGIGFAMTERRVVDMASGVVLNANLEEYKVPTVADVCPVVHARVDMPDLEANSTGAKGIGEPPLIPTAPAIANAVFDAIGVRIRELPIARDRLLLAIDGHLPVEGRNR